MGRNCDSLLVWSMVSAVFLREPASHSFTKLPHLDEQFYQNTTLLRA
ncbi:MAG TPA: hypothetical protein VJO34_11675 [Methylomirabilota bacterium]|nr:hypothetical protein [Methylomirabilota bacterium]